MVKKAKTLLLSLAPIVLMYIIQILVVFEIGRAHV